MTTYKTQLMTLASVAVLATAACGGGGSSSDAAGIDAVRVDSSNTVDASVNVMPTLLPNQIDRAGRPAVSTALLAPFEADALVKDATLTSYNGASFASWSAFIAALAGNLAVLDALDTHLSGGGCGNQPLFDEGTKGAPGAGYALAGPLADDRLFVDTTQPSCAVYLGVEAFTLGLTKTRTCGGRVPAVLAITQDPVDMSYAILAGGLARLGMITDGVSVDDQQATVSNDTFPFLAAPTAP